MSRAGTNGRPKPRLVFRLGIVGHRPDRLELADLAALGARFRELIAVVRDVVDAFGHEHGAGDAATPREDLLFAADAPVLRAVSPLAEGVDRLFAEAALDFQCELCSPMPFARAEFEKDFAPGAALERRSLERFRDLQQRAARETRLIAFEMDGNPADRDRAYEACTDVVVNQSDLLFIVWDGERRGLRAGTEQAFADALRRGVPLVWIDARAPHAWQVVDEASSPPDAGVGGRAAPAAGDHRPRLSATVRRLLDVPAPPDDGRRRTAMAPAVEDFYEEKPRRLNAGLLWILFRGRRADDSNPAAEDAAGRPVSPFAAVADRLEPFHARLDGLAVFYSDLYRSGFILAYLLSAAAVLMDLVPLALGWNVFEPEAREAVFIAIELCLIALVLGVVWRGRRRGWHQRWIDYRFAAELIQHLRLVAPLGGLRPFPSVPAHFGGYGYPGGTPMAWYVRAIERDLGLPAATLDNAAVLGCARHLAGAIDGQAAYHRHNAERCHRIEGRLHRLGVLALAATAAAGAAHLALAVARPDAVPPRTSGALVFLCGVLPAVGASLAGISNQGEYRRVSRRSQSMEKHFDELSRDAGRLIERLGSVPGAGASGMSREVDALAARTARLMLGEVLDWRVVFLDQPLRPPA